MPSSGSPALGRRDSTSSIASSHAMAQPTLSRRASTSSMDMFPRLKHAGGTSNDKDPPLNRRREESECKTSRWAPNPPLSEAPLSSLAQDNSTPHAAKTCSLAMDLSQIRVDVATVSRCVYFSQLGRHITESALDQLCRPYGLEIDPSTTFPRIEVFMCQRTLRPRRDAAVYFNSPGDVTRAIPTLQGLRFGAKQIALNVRAMDEGTYRVLLAQQRHNDRPKWTCVQCRTSVLGWRLHCDSCNAQRVFPPPDSDISPTDWLPYVQ
ncbi:hypothetical protein H310_01712 [Aphanomyces invadans]|uniref:Uncharacterized protein n=1 Tax=Aphanomyces invadans TaxID=157072 RepID=A0A024US69_9STRA|nr:hypothetical protein H310_01712 [Aphanomyces invadans]ETW09336.1 hypothetical protein H310_01712 [Aphanomyces invadans]|eukprot:XP_008863141.1 hypothetical protein H310_01712 [Aphanomyces invadans]